MSNRFYSVVALVNRMIFVGQFGQKWAKGSGCCGWVTKLFAEIQVEPDPFVIPGRKVWGTCALSSRRSKLATH